MTNPFVDHTDLAARMRRTLAPAEEALADQLLDDVVGDITARFRDRGWTIQGRIDVGALTADDVVVVACRVVKRAMAIDDDMEGVRTVQETTGPFSGTFTFANPMGDVYLGRADLRRLGLGGQVAFTVPMYRVP